MTDEITNSLDDAFIKHFEADIITAYQQMGSKLRPTVRSKTDIIGASTTFQVIGKGTASTKDRNGAVPVMNVAHTPKLCALQDFYAGDWVDKLDELKIGHDERKALAQMGAYALGRKTDDLIITALATTTNLVGSSDGQVLSKSIVLDAFTKLNNADVPDDGDRYAIVAPAQWNQLLNIEEFSSANYVGDKMPFVAGCETRRWLGINWIMHTGLPASAVNGTHTCFVYHKNAVGHAVGYDVKTDISWHGDHAAYFINSMMSQGAVLIDPSAAIKIVCLDEEPAAETTEVAGT